MRLIILKLCLSVSTGVLVLPACDGHPVSHTDAWVKVSSAVDVRLNVFFDDVIRYQVENPQVEGTATLPVERVRAAIEQHSETLLQQLKIVGPGGRPLVGEIVRVPKWTGSGDIVDLVADANLKLTWDLRFRQTGEDAAEQANTLESLTILHQFSHPSLVQPGELRLHLLHRPSNKRFDSVLAPLRPFTVVFPAAHGESGTISDTNTATARLVISRTGILLEMTAPLLLLDNAWSDADTWRKTVAREIPNAEPQLLSVSDAAEIRSKVLEWGRQNVLVRLNGQVASHSGNTVEFFSSEVAGNSNAAAEVLTGPVPAVGTHLGLRMLWRPPQQVERVDVDFSHCPGLFTEMQTEIVTAAEQTSERCEFSLGDEPTSVFSWQRSETGDVVEESSSAGFGNQIVFQKLHYPGKTGLGIGAVAAVLLGALGFAVLSTSWVRRLCLTPGLLLVVAVGGWLFPDEEFIVNRDAAADSVNQLLTQVYQVSMAADEQHAVAQLEKVLQQDLAEEVYLGTLSTLSGQDPNDPLLVEVTDVCVEELTASLPVGSAEQFTAQTQWRVSGMVYHWGHSHRRDLVLNGNVKVLRDQGAWKISEISQTQPVRYETPESSGS